jgi:hypothetical protein
MRRLHPSCLALGGIAAFAAFATNAFAQGPQPLPVSKGVYRLPYPDGTSVRFSNDHTNHPASLNRVDMTGQGTGPFTVVASAAGWIRIIVENNDTICPNATNDANGDGIVTTTENNAAQMAACGTYAGPSTWCCETDFEDNGGTCPGSGTCLSTPNNFVWIEHPNGEWTKYTHMLNGSVGQGVDINGNPGAGRFVGEFVGAATPLGIEADVGFASGVHVHFEVGVPNYVELAPPNMTEADPDSPPATVADWFSGGFLVGDGVQNDVLFEDTDGDGVNDPDDDLNLQNRIPIFCQTGYAVDNAIVTAGMCDDQCNSDDFILSGTFEPGDTPYYEQATETISHEGNTLVIEANAGVALRAGEYVWLTPGFHAEQDCYFSASIGACDTPGGTGE